MANNRTTRLIHAVNSLKSLDKPTFKLIETVGPCKFEPTGSPYHVLIRSIVSQQLSTQAASSILKKVLASFKTHTIPPPKAFIGASNQELRDCGLSLAKVETIKRIAVAYNSNEISDKYLESLNDEELTQYLCLYKGIGPWTAQMILIFGLDRWDCFSVGDLGLRKGIEKWYGIARDDKKVILDFTKKFSPYRSILSWYLWASLDAEPWGR